MSAKGRHPAARSAVPMKPADAFFSYAEAATRGRRPVVAGLFMLDPDPTRFRAAIERLTVLMPRLRQRVVDAPLGLGLPSAAASTAWWGRWHLNHNERSARFFAGRRHSAARIAGSADPVRIKRGTVREEG